MTDIHFDFSWDDHVQPETPEEATLAELTVTVGDSVITRNRLKGERNRTLSDSVYGPLGGLADWFIEHWQYIFWETQTPFPKREHGGALPCVADFLDRRTGEIKKGESETEVAELAAWEGRHTLGHATSDLAFPRTVVLTEGDNVLLQVDSGQLQSRVLFVDRLDENHVEKTNFVVPEKAFRSAASAFVEAVLTRATSFPEFKDYANWLANRWKAAQEIEGNPANRLRLQLGSLTATIVENLEFQEPATSVGVRELFSDCPITQNISEVDEIVRVVRADLAGRQNRIPKWRQFAKNFHPNQAQRDYQQGAKMARALRTELGNRAKPFRDLGQELLKPLGVVRDEGLETKLFRTAVCASRSGVAHLLSSSLDGYMKDPISARFAEVAAIGRLLWSGSVSKENVVAGAHGDYSRVRETRRANAFAAEFLLPSVAVKQQVDASSDDDAVVQLAEDFGISRSAARWHVQNVLSKTFP